MRVMWVTGLPLENPTVQYWSANNPSVVSERVASNFTYTVPQKWWPIFNGMIYQVDMDGLEPGAEYTYRVGGYDTANATDRRSADFTFRATPLSDDANRKTRVGVLADHGTFALLGFAVMDKMIAVQESLQLEMVMTVGDLCYAGLSSAMPRLNISKEDEFEHFWDLWAIQNEPIAARLPFMVGPGNHERFYDWTAFTSRYKMPYASSKGNGNFWYAYEYGNSYWISLDSEESLEAGSPQLDWFESTLQYAVANRARVPWVVVTIHKPIYSSDNGSPSFRERLEPLLLQYDVDITFTGHMHCYERIHPSDNSVPTVLPVKGRTRDTLGDDMYYSLNKGPVHVVQGNTGAMQFETWIQPQPAYSAVRFGDGFVPRNRSHTLQSAAELQGEVFDRVNYTDTFGFGSVTFLNSTHMYYEMIPITGTQGTDKFWIVKDRSATAMF